MTYIASVEIGDKKKPIISEYQKDKWREAGLCAYCGGQFEWKHLMKFCSECGKPKDY